MRKYSTVAVAVMLASFGSALVIHTCAAQAQTSQGQTIQGMERKSQNRNTVAPPPAKRHGCNASGMGTRKDCAHTRQPPREIDQDRVGMNTITPPKE